MKKTLFIIAAALIFPLTASADCKSCKKGDATPAKVACEKSKCDKTTCTKSDDDKAKCSKEACQKKCAEYFEKAFKEHDKDQDGKLDQAEFKALITATAAKKRAAKAKCCPEKKCATECKKEKAAAE